MSQPSKTAMSLVPAARSGGSSRPVNRALRSLAFLPLLVAPLACTPEKPAETPKTDATAKPVDTAKPEAPKGPDLYKPAGPFAAEAFVTVDTAPLAAGALTLPAAPKGIDAPPAVCADYLKATADAPAKCDDLPSALAALDDVLRKVPTLTFNTNPGEESARKTRDTGLAALESCTAFPAGLIRALRIDLAPRACGDVLAEPILKSPPKDLRGDIHETLFGQALAARFARAGGSPPTLSPPFARDKVEKFIAGPLGKWMKETATAVEDISTTAAKLHFYGGAIAAVSAGVADLRIVDVVRSAPIPDELQNDEERRNIYYASLDEKLEPRKRRGRDAALVGLKRFAEVGAGSDARVGEARRLLSKLYGGRRVDALDRLLHPMPPAAGKSNLDERLAEHLPTFYAGVLLDPKVLTDRSTLVSFATAGLPLPHRKALPEAKLTPELAEIAARAYLRLGALYWRSTDFEAAAQLLATYPPETRSDDNKLVSALSIALRGGPADVSEMMIRLPLGMNALGQRAALDKLAEEPSPHAGAAAFDSAYLMEITAPERADGLFWNSLAKRYRKAAELFTTDATHKAEAEARASAAEAIAGQVK